MTKLNAGDGDMTDDEKNDAVYAYACYQSYRNLKLAFSKATNQHEITKKTIRTEHAKITEAENEKRELKRKTMTMCKDSAA